MSLPIAWVDKIFSRLTVRYGDRFLNRWKGIDMDAVRFDWAETLSGFKNWPDAISYALDNIDDEKPPTAAMFRAIASRAPKPEVLALPEPKANPEKVAAELAKLAPLRAEVVSRVDHKAWAKTLKARHESGEKLNMNQVRCYRAALNLEAA